MARLHTTLGAIRSPDALSTTSASDNHNKPQELLINTAVARGCSVASDASDDHLLRGSFVGLPANHLPGRQAGGSRSESSACFSGDTSGIARLPGCDDVTQVFLSEAVSSLLPRWSWHGNVHDQDWFLPHCDGSRSRSLGGRQGAAEAASSITQAAAARAVPTERGGASRSAHQGALIAPTIITCPHQSTTSGCPVNQPDTAFHLRYVQRCC